MKLILSLAIGAASLLALPADARACSCSPFAITSSTPARGALDVPLNAAFELLGAFDATTISLRDPQGQSVAVTVNAGPLPGCPGTSAQVVAQQPLLPNTTYVLRATSRYASDPEYETVTFTTGTRLLADDEPEAPRGAASALVNVTSGSSCDDGSVAVCASAESWENVELIARRGDETVLRWVLRAADNTFLLEDVPDCVELRRLGATGRRSAPVTVCGSALNARSFQPHDRDELGVLLCKGGVAGEAAILASDGDVAGGGCALGAGGHHDAKAPVLVAIATMLGAALRRRAARRRDLAAGSPKRDGAV